MHLVFLHETGRSNEMEMHRRCEKVGFVPYYLIKDLINIPVFMVFVVAILLYPFELGESEMFIEANEIISPLHIVPE
jgi:ubiquinol-cytochrome c reductase cytochrome b subunit